MALTFNSRLRNGIRVASFQYTTPTFVNDSVARLLFAFGHPFNCLSFPPYSFGSRRTISSTPVLESDVFEVRSPATGEKINQYKSDSKEQILSAFEQAQEGQKAWNKRSLDERKRVIARFCELLHTNSDLASRTLTMETGKPIAQSLSEVRETSRRAKFFLDNAEDSLKGRIAFEDRGPDGERVKTLEKVVLEPVGVVGHISAWNYPYFVSSNVFFPSLILGNSVLHKASEFSTNSAVLMTRLLHEAGVPKDVFHLIKGGGSTGEILSSSLPDLGALFFTGSVATGRRVLKNAAENLIATNLELGGKDPVYVREDLGVKEGGNERTRAINLKRAAHAIAEGAFYNCGQSCCAVERVYVHENIFRDFVQHFVEAVRGFKMGDPLISDTFVGPLTRRQHLRVLAEQVHDALAKGASIEFGQFRNFRGAEELKGNFFPPLVLTSVDHSMRMMTEESFGPIIGIQSVESDEEAVSLMNDSLYGLTASVFTKQKEKAEEILSALDVGTGYWNCCDRTVPRLPWSGRRHSGLGVSSSLEGMKAVLKPKAMHWKMEGMFN